MSRQQVADLAAELRGTRNYVTLLGDRFLDAHPRGGNQVADPQVPLEAWTAGLPVSSGVREHLLAVTDGLDRAVHLADNIDGSVRPLRRTLARLQNQLCDTCLTLGIDVEHCLRELGGRTRS